MQAHPIGAVSHLTKEWMLSRQSDKVAQPKSSRAAHIRRGVVSLALPKPTHNT